MGISGGGSLWRPRPTEGCSAEKKKKIGDSAIDFTSSSCMQFVYLRTTDTVLCHPSLP